MHYYRARFYDAQIGRFISEDPIGLGGGINQFAYVGNNPIISNDPEGLFPSIYPLDYHQRITQRALSGLMPQNQIDLIMQEQYDFDSNTQDEIYSPWHAMRRRNQSPEDARREANGFIRQNICLARKLKKMGLEDQALPYLSRAMHTLQDSASPAHYDFQPAWEDTWGNRLKQAGGGHYWKEGFDPIGGMASNNTRRAGAFYNGQRMPGDFFVNISDTPQGAIYSPMTTPPSPDGGNCDCE